jgi:hypothetical protein
VTARTLILPAKRLPCGHFPICGISARMTNLLKFRVADIHRESSSEQRRLKRGLAAPAYSKGMAMA